MRAARCVLVKRAVLALVCSIATLSPRVAAAYNGGINGVSVGGCGGGDCHGPASTSTSASVRGPLTALAGSTHELELVLKNATPTQVAAGFDLSATAGTLTPSARATLTQRLGRDLTHRAPIASATAGTWIVPFVWTAPMSDGPVELRFAVNAVNRSGGNDGDEWNVGSVSLEVSGASSIDASVTDSATADRDAAVDGASDGGLRESPGGCDVRAHTSGRRRESAWVLLALMALRARRTRARHTNSTPLDCAARAVAREATR